MRPMQAALALVLMLTLLLPSATGAQGEMAPPDPADGIPILVYFSRRSDDDWSTVHPVRRSAPDLGVARFALASLIAGPTPDEQAEGLFSDLGSMLQGASDCGGPDLTVRVSGGVADVRFCRPLASAGVGQDARARVQIEATLLQFPTVRRVRLRGVDGHCLFDQSGLDRCLAD